MKEKLNIKVLYSLCALISLSMVSTIEAWAGYTNLSALPPTGTASGVLVKSGALVINAKSNQVIKNLQISNPSGDCIVVQGGSQNIQIANSTIGPCGGNGINIISSKNVIVKNVKILGTVGNSVQVSKSDSVIIAGNRIDAGQSSVYVVDSTQVRVEQNTFNNVKGPRPRGNFVQFNRVSGAGNRIACNFGQNILWQSNPEDAINLYESNGASWDSIQIVGNRIVGGGPSTSGGGIILGDGGGSYQIARDNRLVNPGQYGVSIAGGNHNQLLDNQVMSAALFFSNIGLYAWNQYSFSCNSLTVSGNHVHWLNKNNVLNGAWNGGNCGQISGWNNNDFNAGYLSANTLTYEVPAECAGGALMN